MKRGKKKTNVKGELTEFVVLTLIFMTQLYPTAVEKAKRNSTFAL